MSDANDDGGPADVPKTTNDRLAEQADAGGGGNGISTALQPGGTLPGGGPGASQGSLGTGGAQTGGAETGAVKKDGV